MKNDYYNVLGVTRDASKDEIKRAFKRLALEKHPDRTVDVNEKITREKEFKMISEAFNVLSDDDARQRYDHGDHIHATYSGFSGLGDIFKDIFGSNNEGFDFFPFQTSKKKNAQRAIVVEMELRDAIFGMKKEINLHGTILCQECNGRCFIHLNRCQPCKGTGYIETAQGFVSFRRTCHMCNGHGGHDPTQCKHCGGSGSLLINDKIMLEIPPGIVDHSTLNVKTNDGQAVQIIISVLEDKNFYRSGDNIVTTTCVPFWNIAAKIPFQVKGLDEKSHDVIFHVTDKHVIGIVEGEGIPGRGSLIVNAKPEFPELSSDSKKLLEQIDILEK